MINKISQYPIIANSRLFSLINYKRVTKWMMIIFPLGALGYWLAKQNINDLIARTKMTMKVNQEVVELLTKENEDLYGVMVVDHTDAD